MNVPQLVYVIIVGMLAVGGLTAVGYWVMIVVNSWLEKRDD